MKRRKQTVSLERRLAVRAKQMREEARGMPGGSARDELLREARRTETASHLSAWLKSPGLRPPK